MSIIQYFHPLNGSYKNINRDLMTNTPVKTKHTADRTFFISSIYNLCVISLSLRRQLLIMRDMTMRCLRLKAACAIALMLLSLAVNANAYGNGKNGLLKNLTTAVADKLPPSLTKKIVTGFAITSFIFGGYNTASLLFSTEKPQPIEQKIDFIDHLPDGSALVITTPSIDSIELKNIFEQIQSGNLSISGESAYTISIVDAQTLARLQTAVNKNRGEDIIWLEHFKDNELSAFTYDYTRHRDLSRAAFYLITGLVGGAIILSTGHLYLYSKDTYPDSHPYPAILLILWQGGGVLLGVSGMTGTLMNLGLPFLP